MHRQVLWSLDLNTKNNLNGGFHCRHEDVTMEQMKVAYRAMMEDLNRTAKAQDWHCIVIGGVSQIDPSNGTYKAPHIHLLIYGTPCWTVVNHLLSYWTSHGYANSIPCAKKKCTTDGKISYVWAQVPDLPIRRINYGPAYASELFGCNEADAMEKLKSKRDILKAFVGYKDEDIRHSTNYYMIEEGKRLYDVAFLSYLRTGKYANYWP